MLISMAAYIAQWTPAAIFAQGQQGVWYETKPEYLYQDAAGTTPVTADGDPVGYMQDLSGNGNHATQSTSAARPIYRTDGVLHWLEFDGVDDKLLTPDISFLSGVNTSNIFLSGRLLQRSNNAGFFTVAAGSTTSQTQRTLADSGLAPSEQMKVDIRDGGHVFTADALADGSYEALFENGASIGGGVNLAEYTETARSHNTANGVMTIGVGLVGITPLYIYGVVAVDNRLFGSSRENVIRHNASLAGVTL